MSAKVSGCSNKSMGSGEEGEESSMREEGRGWFGEEGGEGGGVC
jgi:hypothetical protein